MELELLEQQINQAEAKIEEIEGQLIDLSTKKDKLKTLLGRAKIYGLIEELVKTINLPHLFVSQKLPYLKGEYYLSEDLCLILDNDIPYMIRWNNISENFEVNRIHTDGNNWVITGTIPEIIAYFQSTIKRNDV